VSAYRCGSPRNVMKNVEIPASFDYLKNCHTCMYVTATVEYFRVLIFLNFADVSSVVLFLFLYYYLCLLAVTLPSVLV